MEGGGSIVAGSYSAEDLKSLLRDSVWYWADLETPNNDHYQEVHFYGHILPAHKVGQENMATSSNLVVQSESFTLGAPEARMGQANVLVSSLKEGCESEQMELALSQIDRCNELDPAFMSFMPRQSVEIRGSDPAQSQVKVSPNQNSIPNQEEQQQLTTEPLWKMILGPETPILHEKSVLVANSQEHPHPAENQHPENDRMMQLQMFRHCVSNNQHFKKPLVDLLAPGPR